MGGMSRKPLEFTCMLLKIIYLPSKTKYGLSLKQICLNNNAGTVMHLKYLIILNSF